MPSLKPNGKRLNGKGSKWITPLRRTSIYLRDGFLCRYCGRNLKVLPKSKITLDHLTPRESGGGNESKNLITACTWCNSKRRHRKLSEFVPDPKKRRRIYAQARRKLNLSLALELRAA